MFASGDSSVLKPWKRTGEYIIPAFVKLMSEWQKKEYHPRRLHARGCALALDAWVCGGSLSTPWVPGSLSSSFL